MTEFIVDLEWFRDPAGYRLLDPVAPEKGSSHVDPFRHEIMPTFLTRAAGDFPQRVLRNGGKLESYFPLQDRRNDRLCFDFAACARTPEGILDFVERYGPLTREGLEGTGDPIPHVMNHAEAMYSWTKIGNNIADILGTRGVRSINLPRPELSLFVDPVSKRFRPKICPSSLLDALWLQFGLISGEDVLLKTCLQCGIPFEAGPGTGRQKNAVFCSDQHRILFHSLKRSSA